MKKIEITFGFCSLICFVGWLNWRVCIWFICASFAHELGHLLAMGLCGIPILGIKFSASGAVIKAVFSDYKTEMICTFAGPVAGVIFGLGLLRIVPGAAMVSLMLSTVNLLPLYPLDGGRVLKAIMLRYVPEKADARMKRCTSIVCCMLMVLACWGTIYLQMGVWPIFASLALLWRAGGRE